MTDLSAVSLVYHPDPLHGTGQGEGLLDSSNASAEISSPRAKASNTPVTRLGGLHRAPATAPITSALEAPKPNNAAVSTVPEMPHQRLV